MPTVDPSQVPNQPCVVARVTVASIVLSPSSARKKAIVTAKNADLVLRCALDSSSTLSLSPRSVHRPKATKATPAKTLIGPVGRARPTRLPRATEKRWTTAVAVEMAAMTVQNR